MQIDVGDAKLTEEERTAIAGLSKSFQDAVDGLTSVPPKLALGALAKFNTSVLSSVSLEATVGAEARPRQLQFPGRCGPTLADGQDRGRLGPDQRRHQQAQPVRQRPAADDRHQQLPEQVRQRADARPGRCRPHDAVQIGLLGPAQELWRLGAGRQDHDAPGHAGRSASHHAVRPGRLLRLDQPGAGRVQSVAGA
ncbi:hypothetical protein WJ972_07550 [Achromobacter insuavis]